MAPPVHIAVYERDRWSPAWNVWIEGLPGVHTFGTRLAHARVNVREALALWLDTDESSLEIRDEVRLPESADEALAALAAAQQHLARSRRRVATATARAVRVLGDAGLSMRDAAALMGLSHQRVAQVAAAERRKAGPTPGSPSADIRPRGR